MRVHTDSENKATPKGLRYIFFSITFTDLYMVFILIIFMVGIGITLQMYSSVESINRMKQLNFLQIITWQKIGQRIEFFIETRENRVESDVLISNIQQDLANLIQKSENLDLEFKKNQEALPFLKYPFQWNNTHDSHLQSLNVDPELKKRAIEVRDAPISIVRSNFDYWPIPTTNGIQSGRYIAPLYVRADLLSQRREQQLRILYTHGSIVIVIAALGITVIWLCFLRPTVRKLSDARADTQFILDNAPGFICSYSPDGRFMSANQAYLDLVGVTTIEKLKGKHISEIVGPSNWPKMKNHVERVSKGEKIEFEIELEFNNAERVLLASYRPKLALDGTLTAIVALIVDITDRYKTERALRLSEENLRITLNSIGEAVIAADTQGKIVRINSLACHLTGWAEIDAISRDLREVFNIIDAKSRKTIISPVDQVLTRKLSAGEQNNTLLLSKNGNEYQISNSGAPILSPEGETVGVVLVFRDITEERLLNEKLTQSEKLRSIGQLADGIAHDFNNILVGIQVSIDLIALSESVAQSNENSKLIKGIHRLIRRGADLTEHLMLFARTKESFFKPVNVSTLTKESFALVRSASGNRIIFELEDHSHSSVVFGSETALQTALLNILLNAVDAISDTGIVRVVLDNTEINQEAVREEENGLYLSIRISDTGSGICKENLGRIFDPFFTTKEVGKGTGLGLAATYGTIQDHKGNITVHSQENAGTEFTILLACYEKNKLILQDETTSIERLNTTTDNLTVLFADDEERLGQLVQSYLENFNYKVLIAKNGQECIDLFKKHQKEIDILFLDMNMPIKSGADVIKEIGDLLSNSRIIVSTGYLGKQSDFNKIDDRIVSVLKKPYPMKYLVETIEAVMEQNK